MYEADNTKNQLMADRFTPGSTETQEKQPERQKYKRGEKKQARKGRTQSQKSVWLSGIR